MQALVHMCHFHFPNGIHFGEKFTNDSIFDVIKDIAPRFDDILHECEWQNERVPCKQIFSPSLTGGGICYAFNALNTHDYLTDQ